MPAVRQPLVQYFDSTYVNGPVARLAGTRTNHVRRPSSTHVPSINVEHGGTL